MRQDNGKVETEAEQIGSCLFVAEMKSIPRFFDRFEPSAWTLSHTFHATADVGAVEQLRGAEPDG